MEYMSALEASEKWGVSLRQVQRLLSEGRISRAKKYGKSWMIPLGTEKPGDPRRDKNQLTSRLSDELAYIIAASTDPMPCDHPDEILEKGKERRLQLQYEAELAYLRGDYETTMSCFRETEGDDAARLRACPIVIAAAISLGDYKTYTEIESFLKKWVNPLEDRQVSIFAELALATAAVSVTAPEMAPEWLKEGDLSALPGPARPDALYLRAKYLHCAGNYEGMLSVAQTALTLSEPRHGFTLPDLYLRVTCAVACNRLGKKEAARRWLLDAMCRALPHGFYTPFPLTVYTPPSELKTGGNLNGTDVYFGEYNNAPIHWNVVAKDAATATLWATNAGIANRIYHVGGHANWSGSDVCMWLNGTGTYTDSGFSPQAFAAAEQAAIPAYGTTEIANSCLYLGSPINNLTIDISQKVVLPSIAEIGDSLGAGTWYVEQSARFGQLLVAAFPWL